MDHIPVLLNEIIENLAPLDGGVYIDCTFGAGGYTKKILNSANCKVYAIDQDSLAINYANKIKENFSKERFEFYQGNFSQLKEICKNYQLKQVDGIIFDLGVSSMQIDNPERGFSFSHNGPLDMRMSDKNSLTAAEVINKYQESDLADIIYYYGDETYAKKIAAEIVKQRKIASFTTTKELADLVSKIVKNSRKIHPATKTFQAIRIYVNQELESLKQALEDSLGLINSKGKILIVSFQGLEDKVVKDICRDYNLSSSLIKPSREEIKQNYRSRSAKLRVICQKQADGGDDEKN